MNYDVIDTIFEVVPEDMQMTLILSYLALSVQRYEEKKGLLHEELIMQAMGDEIYEVLQKLEEIERKINEIILFTQQIKTGTLPEPAERPDLDALAKEEP